MLWFTVTSVTETLPPSATEVGVTYVFKTTRSGVIWWKSAFALVVRVSWLRGQTPPAPWHVPQVVSTLSGTTPGLEASGTAWHCWHAVSIATCGWFMVVILSA